MIGRVDLLPTGQFAEFTAPAPDVRHHYYDWSSLSGLQGYLFLPPITDLTPALPQPGPVLFCFVLSSYSKHNRA
jgi:hypothetical protein